MPEPHAHRTLVKSPPELWAEISDLEALTRHLGEFGEIRITRLEPETTVAWEGDRARGTVELEPSGWGTKVTLTAELNEAVPEPEPQPDPLAAEQQPERDPEPVAAEPEPLAAGPDPAAEPPAAEPESEPIAAEPAPAEEPRVGLFARLFGRRRKAGRADVAEADLPAESAPPEPEPEPEPVANVAAPEPEPEPEPVAEVAAPEPEPEPVAAASDPLDGDRAQAILTGVLDDLGSAHHRPFSRG